MNPRHLPLSTSELLSSWPWVWGVVGEVCICKPRARDSPGNAGIEDNRDVKLELVEPGATTDGKELCQEAGQQIITLNGRG